MSFTGTIAFLGGGVMATAIYRALLGAGVCSPDRIRVSDVVAARRDVAGGLGVSAFDSNREAIRGADVVVLAVKPQDVVSVLTELRGEFANNQLLISIAPGFTTARLEEAVGGGAPVIRVMPNTPVLVGEGASGFCRGSLATAEHAATAREILSAGGRCVEVAEKLLDAVTGLSGSGPAYVCLVVEALADGGVKAGLPRDVAMTLAIQTVLGTAKLLAETGDHPAVWKDRVATPAGTTIAGLAALEAGGLRSALIGAVDAASRRSAELGKG